MVTQTAKPAAAKGKPDAAKGKPGRQKDLMNYGDLANQATEAPSDLVTIARSARNNPFTDKVQESYDADSKTFVYEVASEQIANQVRTKLRRAADNLKLGITVEILPPQSQGNDTTDRYKVVWFARKRRAKTAAATK